MVSEKQVDAAMRFLLEWYENNPDNGGFPKSSFESKYNKLIYNTLLAENLVETKISIHTFPDGKWESFYCCSLTDKGNLYFIEKRRKQRTSRKQFIQNILIAVISALLTYFFTQRSEESETSSSRV